MSIDIAPAGLQKAVNLAEEMNTSIRTMEADINDLALEEEFDIIYSMGTIQYIQPSKREAILQHLKEKTSIDGLNALMAFVEHPDVEIAPDWGKNEFLYKREELISYYKDWKLLFKYEFIFDCNSSGIPHQHAGCIIIVQKPSI